MKTKSITLFTLISIILIGHLCAKTSAYIDDDGIVRWSDNDEELCVFGTNYSAMFAYWDWRAPIEPDYKKVIDEDVYHIARLGLDGYRIHIWENLISDAEGNLTYNEHFQLFDYLLFKLKERGIKLLLTPMYINGGDYGFTAKYGMKKGCLSNPEAFDVQANYLAQFVNHVNPYTGVAYKDEPDIIAFEIVNEPHHYVAADLATGYINQMYDAIRSAGCEKPLFYNTTTTFSEIDKVFASKADGATLQWYPSGLTSNHDQRGNLLPNVDQYVIPFEAELKKKKWPKFVYEFSPSDIGDSAIMYPAMARSFREAGFQFAAHFAYDPLHAAYCNVEYKTHFLNLAYTPQKAIGMMIAGEVFRRTPLGKSYGRFPENNVFDAFRLSYEENLAEMVTDEKFIYSNNTFSKPEHPELLKQVVGVGSSPVVKYEGNGAYFLDKLESGIWRLEVMPDVAWVKDPFFVPDVNREAAVTINRRRVMVIRLGDLGEAFEIQGLNEGNDLRLTADGQTFAITPGTYLLNKRGAKSTWTAGNQVGLLKLGEFHAPTRKLQKDYLLHKATTEVSVGHPLRLSAEIVSEHAPESVSLFIAGIGSVTELEMNPVGAFGYEVEIPEAFFEASGTFRYYISYRHQNEDEWITYPSGNQGFHINDRRLYSEDETFEDGKPYETRVVEANLPICLFDAVKDWHFITKTDRKDKVTLKPISIPGKSVAEMSAKGVRDPENGLSIRYYCWDNIQGRIGDLEATQKLVLYGHSLNEKNCKLEITLMQSNGMAFGAVIELNPEIGNHTIDLENLKPVKTRLMPRAYPKFQKNWFRSNENVDLDLSLLESVQLTIGPQFDAPFDADLKGVAIAWISME